MTKQYGYPSVSCRDFEVMLTDGQQLPQDPQENVALNKDATSSSNETSGLNASKAFDGDHTTRDSRWASALGNGPHWISVDLGEVRNIKTVVYSGKLEKQQIMKSKYLALVKKIHGKQLNILNHVLQLKLIVLF